MTTLLPPARVGAQEPRLLSVPPAASSAGDEAIELAARAGLILDPWQQLVLRGALGEDSAGKWAAFEVGLVVPRQCGKGSVLEALELAALFLFGDDGPPPLILHSAHEFKTSAEHFRRMRDLIESSPLFSKKVRIIRTAAGSEAIELHSGARLRFVTRTGGSGRGFSADLIVIDEAYNLTAEAMAAVLPTMSARPNPQIWYTSSAGMVASSQLRRVRDRGIEGGGRLAYFEWSAPDDADLDDREAWAQANPAMGIRIPESFIEAEREAMPDEQFARERLGIWFDPTTRGQIIAPEAWNALRRDAGDQPPTLTYSLEVQLGRTAAVVGVAWQFDNGTHVEIARAEQGTEWVTEWLIAATRKRPGSVVVDNGGEAVSFIPALEAAGVVVHRLGGTERAQACGSFYDAAVQGSLSHDGNPLLADSLTAASWKSNTEGTRTFSRKSAGGDISRLYAAVLAMHGHLTDREAPPNVW